MVFAVWLLEAYVTESFEELLVGSGDVAVEAGDARVELPESEGVEDEDELAVEFVNVGDKVAFLCLRPDETLEGDASINATLLAI